MKMTTGSLLSMTMTVAMRWGAAPASYRGHRKQGRTRCNAPGGCGGEGEGRHSRSAVDAQRDCALEP